MTTPEKTHFNLPLDARPMARYLGDRRTKKVHDLFNPRADCQTEEILLEDRVPFHSLQEAFLVAYDECGRCLDQSDR